MDHRYLLAVWRGNRKSSEPRSWQASPQRTATVLLRDKTLITAFGTGYRTQGNQGKRTHSPQDSAVVRWHVGSAYASSSTVDFDGELYRIWFVGGSPTKDPGVPYGYYDRIGMATSRDGIHWEVANDGKPVLDLGPPGSPDSKGVSHPFVLRVGNRFL